MHLTLHPTHSLGAAAPSRSIWEVLLSDPFRKCAADCPVTRTAQPFACGSAALGLSDLVVLVGLVGLIGLVRGLFRRNFRGRHDGPWFPRRLSLRPSCSSVRSHLLSGSSQDSGNPVLNHSMERYRIIIIIMITIIWYLDFGDLNSVP